MLSRSWNVRVASRSLAAWLASAVFALAVSGARAETPPSSPRNASYVIDVRLDTATRMLDGHQTLLWRNIQNAPASELWFHLYWNAWRNDRSTWMLQAALTERGRARGKIRPGDWGYLEVDSIQVAPADSSAEPRERITTAYYAAPDDGNPNDRTVFVVPLDEPVPPGGAVRVVMDWRAKIPRTFARTGFRGNYYLFAHWFPKLGVFEGDGWNCHQYHATTEYFSDYGSYRVTMTVPERWVVGATGREIEHTSNGDGTESRVFAQDDVHAFTWTVSPDFVVVEDRFHESGLPPVDLRLLMQPEHLRQAGRHLAATRAALEHYGTWYGPYPYDHLTIVDPAYGSRSGGMEYPTLFTCGTRVFNPFGSDHPEGVTVHEAGHQFWYGLVGNNEFEDAWLDEGLNTFSTIRTLDATYPPAKLVRRFLPGPGESAPGRGFFPVMFDDIEVDRLVERLGSYRRAARDDDPSTATFRYFPRTASAISYSKTALWLATLERYLGWDALQQILSTYFERYRFAHPTPQDFFDVANEVSGQDLDWFFDQVYRSAVVFDYAVDSVSSVPAGPTGLVEEDGELVPAKPEQEGGETVYRTEVVVRRLGGGIFPVDVLLVFEDGSTQLESWSGRDHWRNIVVERPSRLDYAVVDPERRLMLDVDYTNNSRRLEPHPLVPTVKWASKWMIWFQDLLAGFAFFV